mgnify:CR=1 FL=1
MIQKGPGFLVCAVIAAISQYIAKFVPQIGAALFAIGIGVFCGNTFLNKKMFSSRNQLFWEKFIRIFHRINRCYLIVKWNFCAWFERNWIYCDTNVSYDMCRLSSWKSIWHEKKFRLLMGAGNAVCGSSAIASVSPILDADTKDKGIAITIVNVTGTVLMVLLPILPVFLPALKCCTTSAMIGGTYNPLDKSLLLQT